MDADNAVTLRTTIVELAEQMRQAAYDEGYEDGKSVGPDVNIRRDGAQVPLSSLADVPQPAPCPSWCPDQPHGWTDIADYRDRGMGLYGTRWCRLILGAVGDYEVCVSQWNNFDTGHGTYEANVQVEICQEDFTPSKARELGRMLIEAAALADSVAENNSGQPSVPAHTVSGQARGEGT